MNKHKSKLVRTLQIAISKEVFNQYYEMIEDHLPPSFYAKPNSKYSTKTIIKYLLMMCAENASHEGIYHLMKDYLDDIGKIDEISVPTGACLLKRIGGSPYLETRDACDIILEATLKHPQIVRMLKKPMITANDENDVPVMLKEMDENDMPAMLKEMVEECVASGKPKGGTSKHLRYTTFKVVNGSLPLNIAIHATGKKYTKAGIVRQAVERNRMNGIISKMHLLDRGYFTADVIDVLNSINQPFIMPAVKNSKVMLAVEAFDNGTGKQVLPYTIRGKTTAATFTLVIVPKKDAKESDLLKDRYLVFATSFSVREARTKLANIPEIYRWRWGIETGYRVAKKVRPFTCSRNPSVRLVLYYFTMFLYNLWAISCWNAGGTDGTNNDVYIRPPIAIDRMMATLNNACKRMIVEQIVSNMFFLEVVT